MTPAQPLVLLDMLRTPRVLEFEVCQLGISTQSAAMS
jgi:hypothetical protein